LAFLTELPLIEARALAANFGIQVESVEALPLGSVNSNFSLRAAGGGRYFARIYEEQAFPGAETEIRLLSALAAAGVPVVRPLETNDGKGLMEYGKKPFAIFPWVVGDWLCLQRVEPAHCEAVGSALASVHLASQRVGTLPEGRFRPQDLLDRITRVEALGSARLAPDLARLRALYAKYLPLRNPDLPCGVCHGDLFRDNVLWNGDRLAALLDFESAAWGSFAYDLMVTALAWCYADELLLPRVEALFMGYSRVRKLEASERAALPIEGALACLRFATTRITDFELRRDAGAPPVRDYRRFLARLEAIEQGAFRKACKALE
jgi:homoserine kinase type II